MPLFNEPPLLNQRHRSPPCSPVQVALVPALVLLLVSVAIPVTMAAARQPASLIPSTGDTTGQTSSSAVVRAGSGTILQPSHPITLPVEAAQVQNLGAATVVVGYDPAVLTVAGCQRNRAFDVGLCNTTYDRDDDGTPDAVRFNLVSLGGLSTTDGNALRLADIAWRVAASPSPGTIIMLEVKVPTFTDTDGFPISVSAENGQVTVGIAQVRISDIMRIAAQWGQSASGDNAQLDLVLDGIIDVQDVSALAGHWRGTWP